MVNTEPVLTDHDRRVWNDWAESCLAWSATRVHRRRVERAREVAAEMLANNPGAYVSWSAGKDSTAMAHLVAEISPVAAMSVKDDLDFPGEEEYVRDLADRWGLALDVVRPAFSLQDMVRDHGVDVTQDVHSRAAALSAAAFYPLVADYAERRGRPGVFLGLRKAESRARERNRAVHGLTYRKADGEVVCTPLADWADEDVYAYLLARGIEPLHVYRCVGLTPRAPGKVRKSWWVGGHPRTITWLRTYYPSIFDRLRELCVVTDVRAHS